MERKRLTLYVDTADWEKMRERVYHREYPKINTLIEAALKKFLENDSESDILSGLTQENRTLVAGFAEMLQQRDSEALPVLRESVKQYLKRKAEDENEQTETAGKSARVTGAPRADRDRPRRTKTA